MEEEKCPAVICKCNILQSAASAIAADVLDVSERCAQKNRTSPEIQQQSRKRITDYSLRCFVSKHRPPSYAMRSAAPKLVQEVLVSPIKILTD